MQAAPALGLHTAAADPAARQPSTTAASCMSAFLHGPFPACALSVRARRRARRTADGRRALVDVQDVPGAGRGPRGHEHERLAVRVHGADERERAVALVLRAIGLQLAPQQLGEVGGDLGGARVHAARRAAAQAPARAGASGVGRAHGLPSEWIETSS